MILEVDINDELPNKYWYGWLLLPTATRHEAALY